MNQPDRILSVLEPPRGGLERLRARRDAVRRWEGAWWTLAAGGATAAAWLAVVSQPPHIRMPMAGERLIGERSHGVEVQILNGRAVALPSADPHVRIYRVEPAAAPATGQ